MTVLTIRSHKRFGVCRAARLRGEGGDIANGLLVEVSLEGCRISNLKRADLAAGNEVCLEIGGWPRMDARVRWSHDDIAGLQLVKPLHNDELADLVNLCRSESPQARVRRA